jgi:hypothetical protein
VVATELFDSRMILTLLKSVAHPPYPIQARSPVGSRGWYTGRGTGLARIRSMFSTND